MKIRLEVIAVAQEEMTAYIGIRIRRVQTNRCTRLCGKEKSMKFGNLFIEEKARDNEGSKKNNYDLCC